MSSIIDRSDMTAVRDQPYDVIVAYGISGISEMYAGFDKARSGWLKTVAVCLTLYSRQGESEIRKGLIAHQSEGFNKSLDDTPDRQLEVAHVIVALNGHVAASKGAAISGAAKTRLKQGVEYICKLGDTLEERINKLGEFESFNALIKKVREDEAGRVTKPIAVPAQTDNLLNGERKFAERFYKATAPAKARFEVEDVNGSSPIDGLWVALCRSSGSGFEVVRLSRQKSLIEPMIAEAQEQDRLLRDELGAQTTVSKEAAA
ncbi:hypothetical protein AD945_04300 [Gluconobacter albidus]|uniref:Uncharacterized protein n=1 Tax=Gluconobacter albidus TaxID=318683 RepID=A0A149TL69_9PROT|nr:hypothetical protein [Gluconobacter albidus]KXV49429.1 hypothetical protein AD945_04300 [Gluconobacter albidus]